MSHNTSSSYILLFKCHSCLRELEASGDIQWQEWEKNTESQGAQDPAHMKQSHSYRFNTALFFISTHQWAVQQLADVQYRCQYRQHYKDLVTN